jgi:primosomal protein N' (replication factor Y)
MIAEVIVEVSNAEVDKVFDYKIPDFLLGKNIVGFRVLVPFGPRKIEGYVIDQKDITKVEPEKLKEIIKLIDEEPAILSEMISLMYFMTNKFHLKKVDVLRLFIPSEMRGEKVKPLLLKSYVLNGNFDFSNLKLNKKYVIFTKEEEYITVEVKN